MSQQQRTRSTRTRKQKTRIEGWLYRTQTAIEMVDLVLTVAGALKGGGKGLGGVSIPSI